MSYGMGANVNLVAADEKTVIYEYGNYNLNDPKYRKGTIPIPVISRTVSLTAR